MATQTLPSEVPVLLQSTVSGSATTDLDAVLAGLPWQDSFKFGMGIDAITGGAAATAVKPFTPKGPPDRSSSEHYRFIKSETDLSREVQASASGKYNIGGVDVTASTKYLEQIKFSELHVTLIAQFESRQNDYDDVVSYELTDDAKKYLSEPDQFRKRFGDYFLAGGKRISRFTATYTCSAQTAADMSQFELSLGGQAPEAFTAEGSLKLKQAAAKSRISIAADVFMEGYAGTPPPTPQDPEGVMKALAWFKEHAVGRYLAAKLYHYSMIDPAYPRAISIDPLVFVDLRQLYTTAWDVRSRYHSCPRYYRERLKKDYTDLDAGITAYKTEMAKDQVKRLEYQGKATRLLSQLNDVYDRMDFYFKVKQLVGTEPAKESAIEEGKGQQIWQYGFSTYTKSPAVLIQSNEQWYVADAILGWREHTFQFGPDDSHLIVGWQMISNWNDGSNGFWWKAVDQILLRNYAATHVKSLHWRGTSWNTKTYYVDAKDYQFEG